MRVQILCFSILHVQNHSYQTWHGCRCISTSPVSPCLSVRATSCQKCTCLGTWITHLDLQKSCSGLHICCTHSALVQGLPSFPCGDPVLTFHFLSHLQSCIVLIYYLWCVSGSMLLCKWHCHLLVLLLFIWTQSFWLLFQILRGAGHHVYADRWDLFNTLVEAIASSVDQDELPNLDKKLVRRIHAAPSTANFQSVNPEDPDFQRPAGHMDENVDRGSSETDETYWHMSGNNRNGDTNTEKNLTHNVGQSGLW